MRPIIEWATYFCRYAQLGDARLKTRLVLILQRLMAHPHAPLAEALGTPQQVATYYDFLRNPRVTPTRLLAVATADTVARMGTQPILLAIQDTTEYNYTSHPGTTGQGPLSHPQATGLHVHTTLAATPDGVPQGVLHQHCWARDPEERGVRGQRRTRAFAEKESARWLESLQATHDAVPAGTQVITVADREADIYELFATPRPAHSSLLIRVSHNRRVTVPDHADLHTLEEAAAAAPCLGGRTIEVRRGPDRPARRAKVTIHALTLQLHRPRNGQHDDLGQPTVTLVVAREVETPVGQSPILWLLLTDWPVPDLAAACQVVYWYSLRWLVERYHYTLKSGCQLETLQLRSVEGLERALLLYAMVAWRLLWLTYLGRACPDASCEVALTPCEWQTLHEATETTPVPATPPSLQTAIEQLGRLGGHRGWPSSGPPGVHVLWRGWTQLQTLVAYVQRVAATAEATQASQPLFLSKPAFDRAA